MRNATVMSSKCGANENCWTWVVLKTYGSAGKLGALVECRGWVEAKGYLLTYLRILLLQWLWLERTKQRSFLCEIRLGQHGEIMIDHHSSIIDHRSSVIDHRYSEGRWVRCVEDANHFFATQTACQGSLEVLLLHVISVLLPTQRTCNMVDMLKRKSLRWRRALGGTRIHRSSAPPTRNLVLVLSAPPSLGFGHLLPTHQTLASMPSGSK